MTLELDMKQFKYTEKTGFALEYNSVSGWADYLYRRKDNGAACIIRVQGEPGLSPQKFDKLAPLTTDVDQNQLLQFSIDDPRMWGMG